MKQSVLISSIVVSLLAVVCIGCQKQEATDAAAEDLSRQQITDIEVGEGIEAVAGDLAVVHYTGWLWVAGAKGHKFDSSHDRREPFSFVLDAGGVIDGWDQGVVGMKVGGKRNLRIPPDLAYGNTDNRDIPANSALFFEVELIAVPRVQIEDLFVGEGPLAEDGDTVSVLYTGWLFVDGERGTQFDSSTERNQPTTFDIGQGQVIRGWDQGMVGMKVGGKRILTIPPLLAYGARGRLGRDGKALIPPHAAIQLELELLHVMGKQ
ncbi:MAG: FKBP-type peptidyl-prolyl cis-trans isomerase [bacterium]